MALYLFPTLLADVDPLECLPQRSIEKILSCEVFIVEELRTARRFLKRLGYEKSLDEVSFTVINEHTQPTDLLNLLTPLNMGKDIFLMSEAGLPCVADPGSKVVALAHKINVRVVPLVGPSSIYMSLMASGFNGQNFAFGGYLPVRKSDREKQLRKAEERCYKENQTQIFIETPYRNDKLFQSMLEVLREDTMLCVASDITSPLESIKALSIRDWKKQKNFVIGKRNTIFLISI